MNERTVFIYKLIDPLNNEVFYIGYTYNINKRLSEHLCRCNLNNNKYKKFVILKIAHAGLKPEIKVIDQCNYMFNEEARMFEHERLEIYYIKKYRENGVRLTNLTDGGKNAPESKTKKPVYQFDKNLKLVANYESITAAAISMNTHPTHICAAYDQKKYITSLGYYWMSNDDPNRIKIKKPTTFKQHFDKKPRPIVQYDLHGNFIKEYISQSEAERVTNIKSKLINKCLRVPKYDQAGGYLWFYLDNVPNIIKYNGRNFSRKIIAFDLDGNFVGKFNSIRKCATNLHLDETSICKNLKGVIAKTGKYKFKYDDNYNK